METADTLAPDSALRALHEKAGAQFSTWFGCALPERFSDTLAEYQAARQAVALVDTSYRAFVYLEGADRVRYLNAVVSGNIQDLAEGQGTVALLLNPQGHILAELDCYALADRLLVVSHAQVRARTVETLEKFIIMDDVALDDATDRLGSLAVEGPRAAVVLEALCSLKLEAMVERDHAETTLGGMSCRVARRSQFGQPGAEFIADRQHLPALWQALLEAVRAQGGLPIGYAALNALRLEAGVPWFGYDFDDRQIPHQAALETSHINYTKGCYTGQEIVERVRSRGHVNRRRVGLVFSGPQVPAAGTALLAEGKEVGHVTSAAHSPALGRVIGMGYLRREHHAPGSRLECAGDTAEVAALPFELGSR